MFKSRWHQQDIGTTRIVQRVSQLNECSEAWSVSPSGVHLYHPCRPGGQIDPSAHVLEHSSADLQTECLAPIRTHLLQTSPDHSFSQRLTPSDSLYSMSVKWHGQRGPLTWYGSEGVFKDADLQKFSFQGVSWSGFELERGMLDGLNKAFQGRENRAWARLQSGGGAHQAAWI